jgi:hypothetical protein
MRRIFHNEGRFIDHGVDFSYASATRTTAASSKRLPAICIAKGKPFFVNPQQIDIAGLPVTLNGIVIWLAYSRWPDKATRDAAWPDEEAPSDTLPDEIKKAILSIKSCINQECAFPEICMEIKNDLLGR